MRKSILIKTGICVLITAFLLLSPRPLRRATGQAERLSLFRIPEKATLETITLYHIASSRTYQGSVTVFLQDMAKAFERRNRGVYIQVEGMTPIKLAELLENGRAPDAYSFFCGDVYQEQLQRLTPPAGSWLSGLPVSAYAAPYLFSGYVLCRAEPSKTELADLLADGALASAPLHPARLSLCGMLQDVQTFKDGKCAAAILDIRTAGDLLRAGKLPSLVCEPLDGFTDQVCYLGIAKDTEQEKAAWLQAFLVFLLTDDIQAQVTALGAFPVLAAAEPVFANSLLQAVYTVYAGGMAAPDPFLWQQHRAQLDADAVQAAAGDLHAQQRFFERWAVVFGE